MPDASISTEPPPAPAEGRPVDDDAEEHTTGPVFAHARPLVLRPTGETARRIPDVRRRTLVLTGVVLMLGLLGIFLVLQPGGHDDRGAPHPGITGQLDLPSHETAQNPKTLGTVDDHGNQTSGNTGGTAAPTTEGPAPSPDPASARAGRNTPTQDAPPAGGAHPSSARSDAPGGNTVLPTTVFPSLKPSAEAVSPVDPGGEPVSYGKIVIRNMGSGLVLGTAGSQVVQRTGSSGRVWGFADAGGGNILLVLSGTSQCLGSNAASASPGTPAVTRTCSGSAVGWRPEMTTDSAVLLRHASSGLCLGIANRSSANGGKAVLTSCSGATASERWGLEQH